MKSTVLCRTIKHPLTYIIIVIFIICCVLSIRFIPRNLSSRVKTKNISEVLLIKNVFDNSENYPIKLNDEYVDDFTKLIKKATFQQSFIMYKSSNHYSIKVIYKNGDWVIFGDRKMQTNRKIYKTVFNNTFDIYTFISWIGVPFEDIDLS